MKKLILLLLISVLYSCQPRIDNNPETLEKVFAMSKFDIVIYSSGCFGGSRYKFSLAKQKDGYLLKSKTTGDSHLVSQSNMTELKQYLATKIGKDEYGGCTSKEYIWLGSFFHSVDYSHTYCGGKEATIFNELLNYKKLLEVDF